MSGFDLSKEEFGTIVPCGDGVWVMSHVHWPNGMKCIGRLNNRAFLFKIKDPNGDFLFMFGLPAGKMLFDNKTAPIDCVKKLETQVGLKLKVLMSSGDWHHMAATDWMDAFPDTKFYMSGVKLPHTQNGKNILSHPVYSKMVETFDDTKAPESLFKLIGNDFDFVCFNQVMVYDEQPEMSKTGNYEGQNTVGGNFLSAANVAFSKPWTQRYMAIWMYHKPTKQLIAEHNFMIFYGDEHHTIVGKDIHDSLPWWFPLSGQTLANQLFKKNSFKSFLPEVPGATPPADEKIHLQTMQRLMQLEVRAITDMHAWPKFMGFYPKTQKEFGDLLKEALTESGEWDPTGEQMWYKRKKGCC